MKKKDIANKYSSNVFTNDDKKLLKKIVSPLEFRKDLLIEHLHKIQDYFGHLSEKNLILLAKLIKVSEVEVYEVASFYAHFDIVKKGDPTPPKLTLRVCSSLSCELFGSKLLEEELVKKYMHKDIRVLKAPCMGRCNKAPVVEVGHYHLENANVDKIEDAINSNKTLPILPNYETFEDYKKKGGYT